MPIIINNPLATPVSVANGGTNASSASGTALDNITGFSSTGLVARTGAGAYSFRTITGTSGQIDVSNGDGVSGNPTLTIGSLPAFSVNKGGTNQTGIADVTATTLTWSTESYDIGGYFASDGWTPPAGKISLKAAFLASGTWSAGALIAIFVYKNAGAIAQGNWYSAAANIGSALIAMETTASGTDKFTVRAYIDVSSGTATVAGTSTNTYFMGHWISP